MAGEPSSSREEMWSENNPDWSWSAITFVKINATLDRNKSCDIAEAHWNNATANACRNQSEILECVATFVFWRGSYYSVLQMKSDRRCGEMTECDSAASSLSRGQHNDDVFALKNAAFSLSSALWKLLAGGVLMAAQTRQKQLIMLSGWTQDHSAV